MTPKISVICPVQNMEGRLQNLKSWLEKCNSDFQIIIVCDTCTDGTSDEIRQIQGSLTSVDIEIIEGVFGSPGNARNAGLQRAGNDWVIFWDSDDIGEPMNLLHGVTRYSNQSVDAVVFGFEIYEGKKVKTSWNDWPSGYERCLELLTLDPGIWRICFKKASIMNLKFPELRMAEDQIFINDFMQDAPLVVFSNFKIYNYFVSVGGQLTSNKKALRDLKPAAAALESCLNSHPRNEKFALRIYVKILLTQLKKCEWHAKVSAAMKLLSLLITYPSETFRLFQDVMPDNLK